MFDLDDDYDRAAMYKIVLEEGQESDQQRLLNRDILRRDWPSAHPRISTFSVRTGVNLARSSPTLLLPSRSAGSR